MTRIGIVLIVVCALSGAIIHYLHLTLTDNGCGMTPVVHKKLPNKSLNLSAVCAAREIAKDATIAPDDLEIGTIDASEFSKGTVTQIWMAAGQIAAHKIQKGQAINSSDLESVCGPVFRAAKVIPKGKIVTASDVSEFLCIYVRPEDTLLSRELVVGKKAKRIISKEKVITAPDVELP